MIDDNSAAWHGVSASGYATVRDRIQRRQDIIKMVRRRSKGRPVEDIEVDLRREFAVAGIPQAPEMISVTAAGISGSAWSALAMFGRGMRTIAAGGSPAGMRLGRAGLAGDRWIAVDIAGDPSTQEVLRCSARIDESNLNHVPAHARAMWPGPSVRLIAVPPAVAGDDDLVGVLLRREFVGTVPLQLVNAGDLREAIERAEASDRRLMVPARIDDGDTGDVLTLSVALR